MNMQNVQFLWASDEINAHAEEYWTRVMDIARYEQMFIFICVYIFTVQAFALIHMCAWILNYVRTCVYGSIFVIKFYVEDLK